MAVFTFRCSLAMALKLDEYVAQAKGLSTRQSVLEFFVIQFILNPCYLDALDVPELREPLTEVLTVQIQAEEEVRLRAMADEYGVSVAALMRNIIHCGLLKGDRA